LRKDDVNHDTGKDLSGKEQKRHVKRRDLTDANISNEDGTNAYQTTCEDKRIFSGNELWLTAHKK